MLTWDQQSKYLSGTLKLKIRSRLQSFFFTNSISIGEKNILEDIPNLKFEFKKGAETDSSRVFMKLPSLYVIDQAELIDALFDREAHFYKTVLPNLYKLGKCEPFSAKSYAVTDTRAFVIEDLSILGYESGDGRELLNLDQILISLIVLAKFHALGYKYIRTLSDNDPRMGFIRSHPPIIIDKQKKAAFPIFTKILEYELRRELFQKIINKENEMLAEPRTLKYPDKNSMTVLIHGDYRTDNILFKKDNTGQISQAKIIDWQLCGEANPVLDLMYFFITSVPIKIFQENDDLLKDTYLSKLNEELLSAQTNRAYDRTELNRDMSYYKYYYLTLLLYNWPAMLKAKPPGPMRAKYINEARRWMNYLESKDII